MNIKEITGRNYYATKRRKQITDKTQPIDFIDKIYEEVDELLESHLDNKLDEKELADIVLVCFAMAQYNKIDLVEVMKNKMLFNEKRKD